MTTFACSNRSRKMIVKTLLFLSKIVDPPKFYHDDFYEEAKYILAYRMNIFMMVSLGLLGLILFSFYGPEFSIMTFIGFVSVSISWYYIRKTGNYRPFTIFFNSLGAILCLATLFLIKGQPHVIDGLWMIINILFAFLTLSKFWGIAFFVIHSISLSFFYAFMSHGQVALLQEMTPEQSIGLGVNSFVCFVIIFYLSWQNIKTNQFAQSQLNHAKEVLQNQFDTINKQNTEKTVMLKEIHHRVKNNLQVITSLLRLQSRELENEEAISKFRDTTNRVIAMSMIHEKMYQSEELSKINLEEYFQSLTKDLMSSYHVLHPIDIQIDCRIDSLGMHPIVPLALIFNELFSNSLKHAFDHTENPTIHAELKQNENGIFTFTYWDNGTWKKPQRPDSFGLELILTLTEQLEGKLCFNDEPKTIYQFYFNQLDQ